MHEYHITITNKINHQATIFIYSTNGKVMAHHKSKQPTHLVRRQVWCMYHIIKDHLIQSEDRCGHISHHQDHLIQSEDRCGHISHHQDHLIQSKDRCGQQHIGTKHITSNLTMQLNTSRITARKHFKTSIDSTPK